MLALVALLFALLAFYTTLHDFSSELDKPIPDIGALLPTKLSGWSVTDRPVGETEEVMRRMGQILNYDTAFLREYNKGMAKVVVYISYWKPGKAHYRLVYGHTPDVCWTKAGWVSTVQDPAYNISLDTEPAARSEDRTISGVYYRKRTSKGPVLAAFGWGALYLRKLRRAPTNGHIHGYPSLWA